MVEDRILEYLDGSLGDRESAELLETLSVSPEKRALLEEHLRLKDLLALGRKPFTVPIETERSLAERIPILGAQDQDLAPFAGRFAALRSWVAGRSLRIAAGAATLLMLAGSGWYAWHGTNAKPITPSASTMMDRAASGIAGVGTASQDISGGPVHHTTPTALDLPAAHRVVRSPSMGRPQMALDQESSSASLGLSDPAREATIRAVTPAIVPQTAGMAIPDGRFVHSISELLLPQPKDLSRFSAGGSFVLNQSYLPVLSTGPARSLMLVTGDATIDYDLSPAISVGLDFGDAVGSSITNSANYGTPSSDYTRLFENSIVSNQVLYDLLATMHVTLLPESEYQIRLGAGGGDAFGAGPIVQATAGISRVLAPNLILDVTAVASRLWTNGNPLIAPPGNSSEVVGVVGQQIAVRSMYTTALGISAGIRVRLPQ